RRSITAQQPLLNLQRAGRKYGQHFRYRRTGTRLVRETSPRRSGAEVRVDAMRILVHSRIYPSVGGVETVTQLLAHEWNKAGEEVIVATDVSHNPEGEQVFPFPVYYRPSPLKWVSLLRWCDIYLQFNVSLKAMWPLLLIRRPFIFSHHGY